MSCSSTIELTFQAMCPEPGSRRSCSISSSMRSIRPERTVRGRDEEPLEPAARSHPGQLVEQPGEVLADLLVDGEQAEVLVEPAVLGL